MKRKLVYKIMENNISSKEFDLLFLLTSIQNEDGTVLYLYYRDIKNSLRCSTATVYNIIDSLVRKGFLKKEKKSTHGEDFDIRILDNDFSNDKIPIKNDADGEIIRWKMKYEDYISTDFAFLYEEKFMNLPVGAKKLALYYLNRYLSSGRESKDKFWFSKKHYLKKEFYERIGVLPRSIRHYYDLLSDYIDVGYSIERKMNDMFGLKIYDIVTLKDAFKKRITSTFTEKGKVVTKKIYDNFLADEYKVKTLCRKARLEFELQELNDVSSLMHQYRKQYENKVIEINGCKNIPEEKKVKKSLWEVLSECILNTCILVLEPKAIHKALAAHIEKLHFSTYFNDYGISSL